MFGEIKKALKSLDTAQTLSSAEIYYAYKWVEEGCIEVSDEVFSYLINEMCLHY